MADRDSVPLPVGLLKSLNPFGTMREQPPEQAPLPPGLDITLEANDNNVNIDPETGALVVEGDDGSVTIDFNPQAFGKSESASDFGANLAEHIDSSELSRIMSDLLRGIQFDDQSRREWLETRAQGIRILGLKIDPPRSSIDSTASLDGMSNVRHPMLLEAVLRFQANARGELLPADGPVKITNSLTPTAAKDELAEKLEADMNYYLTAIASEYYPDTDRMLLYVGFGGCGFKKVYNCPLRQRPVSESIDAKDLIVSNAATDMKNSGRVTHVISMRPSVLKRMQLAGAYRDVPISTPAGVVPNPVDRQIADTQGVQPQAQQTEDRDHTIYETYCELNILGFEDKDDGEATGLPLPYRVVMEKDSQQILEIRRNWKEDDETKTAKICFVKYPFVPGLGFYDIGLIHILGNTTNALTAAWRELLDAGMFANFPGFLYKKPFGRQNTNEFRVPPGGGVPVDVDSDKIGDGIMPLPYKDITAAFPQFIDKIEQTAQRLGGASEIEVAEGRQDAPVGTTLALIEQATKVEGAVHKRLHAAQAQEFQLLKECFRENPQSFIKAMKQRGETNDWDEQSFVQALEQSSLVPVADPNTPSHMHRLMKAMALVQLDKEYPGQLDPKKVLRRVASMARIDDFDSMLLPPQGNPGIPPEVQLELAKLADKDKDRQAKVEADGRKAQLIQMQDQSESRQFQHENQMQQRESMDQALERQNRLQLGSMSFQESAQDNRAQVLGEQIKFRAAEVEAKADEKSGEHQVKVAEHGVSVAKHGVEAAKHKAVSDKAKATAAARKPKPASKK